jgi:hypothetical protein
MAIVFGDKVLMAGRVVALREHNGYHDSYFYAVYVDEDGESKEMEYAATAYPGGGYAEIDASPELRAAYEAKLAAVSRAAIAIKIGVGKKVKFVRGKKVPIGAEGECFWYGADKFSRYGMRAGVKLESGEKVFVNAANLEVVVPEEYGIMEAIKASEEAAKKAVRKAMVASAGVDEAKVIPVSHAMHAWSDEVVSDFPFDPEASDEALGAWVSDKYPKSSSYGALRWCMGGRVESIDREKSMVRVAVSYGLCD